MEKVPVLVPYHTYHVDFFNCVSVRHLYDLYVRVCRHIRIELYSKIIQVLEITLILIIDIRYSQNLNPTGEVLNKYSLNPTY